MTGHRRDDKYPMSWIETIHETSVAAMEKGWKRLASMKSHGQLN
jgi:hypothetical protein